MKVLATWNDFSGGEYGYSNPARVPRNMWTGLNCLAYPDGSIGPRSGAVRLVANSGGTLETGFHRIGWTKLGASEPLGRVWWLGYPTGNVKYGLLHNFDAAAGAWSTYTGGPIGGVGSARTFGSVNVRPERTYVVGNATELFRINHDTNSLTTFAVGSVPKGRCVALYGNRLYVAGATLGGVGGDNRIHYSDPNAFSTYSATGYFDLPIEARIVAIHAQRDHLVIVQATGNIWIFSGVPGPSANLRLVTTWSEMNDPLGTPEATGDLVHCNQWMRTNNGAVWWMPKKRPVPTVFDGGVVRAVDRMRTYPFEDREATLNSAAALDGPDDLVIDCGATVPWDPWYSGQGGSSFTGPHAGSNSQMFHSFLMRDARGAWFRHAMWVNTTATFYNASVMCQGPNGTVLYGFNDYAGSGVETGVWWWQPNLVQPGEHRGAGINGNADFASTRDDVGSYSNSPAGLPVLAEFTTTEVQSRDGSEFHVRHVVVRFTAFNTGDTTYTDHFDVSVLRRGVYEQPNTSGGVVPADTTVEDWDLAAGSAHGTNGYGRPFVKKFSVNAGRCSAFAVRISAMRGVRIEAITVLGDGEPARVA